jgi:glycolate oxidase
LDETVISLLREYAEIDLPEVEAILLVETDGMVESDVQHQMNTLVALFRECHALDVEMAANQAEAERLWKARKAIGGMIGVLPLDIAPEDVTVPMSRIAAFLTRSQELARKHDLKLFNFGHVGDGNFHTNILYDRSDPAQEARLEPILYDIHKLACDLGGTLSGEHGIGMTKAPYMPLEHDPVALKVMRLLKRTLDPNNILNPGKMLLDG